MSKAVMISIQPKWCEFIASGKKTIEVRKTAPKIDTPFKCYIYCTKDARKHYYIDEYGDKQVELIPQKVIGEFVCDRIESIFNVATTDWNLLCGSTHEYHKELVKQACLTEREVHEYAKEKNTLYCLHISDLIIYDTPKELGEFCTTGHCFNFKNVKCTGNIWGNYIFHYSQNSLCRACKNLDDLGDCRKTKHQLARPPQSWCYVEEV